MTAFEVYCMEDTAILNFNVINTFKVYWNNYFNTIIYIRVSESLLRVSSLLLSNVLKPTPACVSQTLCKIECDTLILDDDLFSSEILSRPLSLFAFLRMRESIPDITVLNVLV